jgi:hypothetical protein
LVSRKQHCSNCLREVFVEPAFHHLPELFRQLGLSDAPDDIEEFIAAHRPLPTHVEISDAPFWTAAQRALLCEQLARDADWAEVVDVLSVRLR